MQAPMINKKDIAKLENNKE